MKKDTRKKNISIAALILIHSIIAVFINCSGEKIYHFSYKQQFLQNQITEPQWKHFHGDEYGVLVYNHSKKNIVYSKNAQKGFIPASVTKLFTAIYALEILGPDFQYKTKIYHDGKIEDGSLNGNLYLLGSGDPSMHYSDLANLVKKLNTAGIQKVSGRFYYIDDQIEPTANITDTMKKTRYYNTSFSGLNYNSNIQSVLRPYHGKNFYLIPPNGQTRIHWKTSNRSYPSIHYNIRDKKWHWNINGKYNHESEFNLPVPDSGYFFAWNFYLIANAHGLKLAEPERYFHKKFKPRISDLEETASLHSLPLYRTIQIMLTFSNNMWAETILIKAAQKQNPQIRNHHEAAQAMKKFFIHKFPDAGFKDSFFENGSGLTSANMVTPFQALTLLKYGREQYNYKKTEKFSFENMLAVSGATGTLRSRFADPGFIYYNRAKTGTLAYAIGLSGFIISKSNEHFIYVIFKQNRSGRKKYENNQSKPADRYEWLSRSQKDIDHQLVRWMNH